MKNVLITGAGGFLGSKILELIYEKDGYEISVLSSKKKDLIKGYSNLSIFNYSDLYENKIDFSQIDVIINCAFARTSDPYELAKSLDFTSEIVKKASKNSSVAFINISSQSVYNPERLSSALETDPVCPTSRYAISKYATEKIVETIFSTNKNPYSNIRLASLTGAGFDYRLTTRFVKTVLENKPINIKGGKQVISYLDGEDAALSIIQMLQVNSFKWKKIYNLGVSESYNLLDIAHMVKKIGDYKGYHPNIIYEESQEFMNNSVNPNRFERDFHHKNHWDLEKDIKNTFIRMEGSN